MRMGVTTTLRAVALFAASSVAAGPSWAADCSKAQTQTDMNICAAQTRAAADEALNATYDTLVKEPLMADRLDKLRAAERSWVSYRDAQCAFEGSGYEGGSMQPMVVDGCAEALTKRQTAALKKTLACARNESGC